MTDEQVKTEEVPICQRCGERHTKMAWGLAEVIMNGKGKIETLYGSKTQCGIANMLEGYAQSFFVR